MRLNKVIQMNDVRRFKDQIAAQQEQLEHLRERLRSAQGQLRSYRAKFTPAELMTSEYRTYLKLRRAVVKGLADFGIRDAHVTDCVMEALADAFGNARDETGPPGVDC